ncbi:MAG: DUF4390 domain-containing protein [Curvibacter sp.]|jgi:hypothetical protein
MMAFITLCWRRTRADLSALFVCALCWGAPVQAEPARVDIAPIELQRNGDSVELATTLAFELPAIVHDALSKGVPVTFVAEAEVYRERWYWFEKRVGAAQRQLRLVYQPLTRRWRVSSGAGETGAALAQSFDTLDDALGVVRRISGWRIAAISELEADSPYRVDFRFRLDTSRLPRPLQIGTLGESDWVLAASASRAFASRSLK